MPPLRVAAEGVGGTRAFASDRDDPTSGEPVFGGSERTLFVVERRRRPVLAMGSEPAPLDDAAWLRGLRGLGPPRHAGAERAQRDRCAHPETPSQQAAHSEQYAGNPAGKPFS